MKWSQITCTCQTPAPFLPIDDGFLSPPRPPGHLAEWFPRVIQSINGTGLGSGPILMSDFGVPDGPHEVNMEHVNPA